MHFEVQDENMYVQRSLCTYVLLETGWQWFQKELNRCVKVPTWKVPTNFNKTAKKLEKQCNIYWCWLLGFCILKWEKIWCI